MEIKLNFINGNVGADLINVYRSNTRFTKTTKPALHETILGDAVSYTDATPASSETQYYMFGVVKGGVEALSICVEASPMQFTGPGPQVLIKGDMDCGYFGTIPSTAFISYLKLAETMKLPGTAQNPIGDNWMKFAHKGKILFISEKPITQSARWTALYDAGLIYGVDGPGPRDVNMRPAVNQLRTVDVRGYRFLVRAPTALPPGMNPKTAEFTARLVTGMQNAGTYQHSVYTSTTVSLAGSEWDDLISKTHPSPNPNEATVKFDNKEYDLQLDPTEYYTRLGLADNVFQELKSVSGSVGRFIGRGAIESSRYRFFPAHIKEGDYDGSSSYFRPVLELMP